jgi:hypothetical protein
MRNVLDTDERAEPVGTQVLVKLFEELFLFS